jgi:hypothetical protein
MVNLAVFLRHFVGDGGKVDLGTPVSSPGFPKRPLSFQWYPVLP